MKRRAAKEHTLGESGIPTDIHGRGRREDPRMALELKLIILASDGHAENGWDYHGI